MFVRRFGYWCALVLTVVNARCFAQVGNATTKISNIFLRLLQVTFIDDSDEYGITHDKAVPLQHVMAPPYDA